MPVTPTNVSWATIFKQHNEHADSNDTIQILIDMQKNKDDPDMNYLVHLRYLQLLFAMDDVQYQGLSILVHRAIDFDNHPAKETSKFTEQLNTTLQKYRQTLPISIQQKYDQFMQTIRHQTHGDLTNYSYCFLFHHHDWVLKNMSNFIFMHSDKQHTNYLQKPIHRYIQQYFSRHCINDRIIKSNLPAYVQYKLELSYFARYIITNLYIPWCQQFHEFIADDFLEITNLAVKYQIIDGICGEQIKNILHLKQPTN